MTEDIKSPVKRVVKMYGKKAIASSAKRNGSFNSTPTTQASTSSDSSEGDSDSEVIESLHLINSRTPVVKTSKGKEKEFVLKHNKSFSATPSRQGSSNPIKTGPTSINKLLVNKTAFGTERKGSELNEREAEGGDVEWDEEVASAGINSKASTSRLGHSKSTVNKPERNVDSRSSTPIKRTKSISTLTSPTASTHSSPVAVMAVSTSVVADRDIELSSPSKPKRLKTTASVPTILHTSASSVRSTPNTINRQPSSPSHSPTKSKSPLAIPCVSSKSSAHIPATLIPTSGSSTSIPLISPSKDLSSLFDMFDDDSSTTAATVELKKKVKTTAGLGGRTLSSTVSSLAPRSPSKNSSDAFTPPHSPSSLKQSNSFPLVSPSTTSLPRSSPNALNPSTSLPHLYNSAKQVPPPPSRTYSRSSTNSGLAPRGISGASSTKRTYGGGVGVSFKRDEEEERFFGFGEDMKEEDSNDGIENGGVSKNPLLPPSSSSFFSTKPHRERESYSTLLSRFGVDLEESQESLDNSGALAGGNTGLKSIAHLREKGENARFGDEFNYLVEGLEKGMGLGVKRASAIEVLRKMLDVDFVRRLMTSGFVERVFVEFRKAEAGDGDRVLDPALAFLIVLLARNQRVAEPLLRIALLSSSSSSQPGGSDVLVVLSAMLGQKTAGEEIGGNNSAVKGLSKGDIKSLASLRSVIDESTFPKPGSFPMTLRALTLVALVLFSAFTPRSNFRPQQLLCTSGALEAVVLAFFKETEGLESRITKYESGLDLLPSDGSINLELIESCLRIFESCSAYSPSESYDILLPHLSSLTSTLSTLVLASHILSLDPNPKIGERAMDCLLSALRMLIDMTNTQSEWSISLLKESPLIISTLIKIIVATRSKPFSPNNARFSRSEGEVKSKTEDGDEEEKVNQLSATLRFDLLCLALGALTNLVESVESTKDLIRETLINSACAESRTCARKCLCSDRNTAIYRLTDLYLDPLEDSLNELNFRFIKGYSGILIGLIMLDVPQNQQLVIEALSDHPIALKEIRTALEEFAYVHDEANGGQEDDQIEATQVEDVRDANMTTVQSQGGKASRIRNMLSEL